MNAPEQDVIESIEFKKKLDSLPKRYRDLFVFHFVMGYSAAEIALFYQINTCEVQGEIDFLMKKLRMEA